MKKGLSSIVVALLTFLVLPFGKIFAYSGTDYKNGLTDIYGYTTDVTASEGYLNNNVSWGMATSASKYVTFNDLMDITTLFFHCTGISTVTLTYGDNSKETITLDPKQNETINYTVTNSYYYDLKTERKGVKTISWVSGGRNNEVEFFGSPSTDESYYYNVSDITHETTTNTVSFKWKNPNSTYQYVGLNLYQDGELIINLSNKDTSFEIKSLSPSTSYTFEFEALYSDGKKSEKKTINVTTKDLLPLVEPVRNLKAVPKYNRVDLSWELPNTPNFEKVLIYRDSKRIFETNGTNFNDLTVQPKTTYEYMLTTLGIDQTESEGTNVTVTTLEEPPPIIEGGELEQQPNGDYLYKWTSPVKGQVKVIVGGKEYKTVPASDKQILIPKEDMKYTVMGNPDIKIVPISESGKEGETELPSKPIENVDIPLTPHELLKASTSLLLILGPFVLLALAFLLVPKFRQVIFSAFGRKKENKDILERRTGKKRIDKEVPKTDKLQEKRIVEKKKKERLPKEPRIKERKLRMARPPRQVKERIRPSRKPRETRRRKE